MNLAEPGPHMPAAPTAALPSLPPLPAHPWEQGSQERVTQRKLWIFKSGARCCHLPKGWGGYETSRARVRGEALLCVQTPALGSPEAGVGMGCGHSILGSFTASGWPCLVAVGRPMRQAPLPRITHQLPCFLLWGWAAGSQRAFFSTPCG